MTGPQVRVVGLERLQRTMRGAARQVVDQSPLNARQARALAAAMRDRAPVRRGVLRGSIVAESGPDFVRVGPRARHGLPVEYGVPARNQEPQPYGRPALAAQAPDYLGDLSDAIQDDLDTVRGA